MLWHWPITGLGPRGLSRPLGASLRLILTGHSSASTQLPHSHSLTDGLTDGLQRRSKEPYPPYPLCPKESNSLKEESEDNSDVTRLRNSWRISGARLKDQHRPALSLSQRALGFRVFAASWRIHVQHRGTSNTDDPEAWLCSLEDQKGIDSRNLQNPCRGGFWAKACH